MTFHFTHADTDIESEAVYEAYYNENDRSLAVVLNSGHGYVYSNVPKSEYDALVGSASVGRYYALVIKRNFGKSEPLGYVGFENENEFVLTASALATVGALPQAAVGTPKGLSLAPNALVTTSAKRITLGLSEPAQPEGIKRRHAVLFTVQGMSGTRTYNVQAGTVDEAVDALSEATAALGLNVNVKEVTVYFE